MCIAHAVDGIADKTIAGNMPWMKEMWKKTLQNEKHMFYPHTTSRAINNAQAEANSKTKVIGYGQSAKAGLQVAPRGVRPSG